SQDEARGDDDGRECTGCDGQRRPGETARCALGGHRLVYGCQITPLSGPQVVPQTTVSPSLVPHTTVSPSLVDHTPAEQSAPPQLDPQTTFCDVVMLDQASPHTIGCPLAVCVDPHPVASHQALTPGIRRPPVRRRFPQMTLAIHELSVGYDVVELAKKRASVTA